MRRMGRSGGDPYAGLVPVTRRGVTVWAERRPVRCPAGHRFTAGKVLVGWLTCRCSYPALGHRTWLCLYLVEGRECGQMTYSPPHSS